MLNLPRTAALIAIVRKGAVIVPHDEVVLEADDELLALTQHGGEAAIAAALR
jgi:Trk K+ transport system NAD-binding subunit